MAIQSAQRNIPKLASLERLIIHTRQILEYEEPLVLAGDFNVIPDPRDATPRGLGE
jgi:exonuclease III